MASKELRCEAGWVEFSAEQSEMELGYASKHWPF
jgi:hypothetical protein